eukprot:TRINITY_DN5855_c0_g2_i1.p1 TRINITY_DN5855_c0_g2~~TRINITY_DN5855_c0_g2_i1.p1  ORF type:complete len:337 (-),score=20.19 TRINITY_DN5855_c0_g2_i1:154-1164(-)
MTWPEWDRRHYVWFAVVLLYAVFAGVPLILGLNQRYIVTCCVVFVFSVLPFGTSAWIVVLLPSLRPSSAQRLLPNQILLLSYILIFQSLALTSVEIVEYGDIPSSSEDASLICTWTVTTVSVLHCMTNFLTLHIIIGFVCFGFGLERLLSQLRKSLYAFIPLGIISEIIKTWMLEDIHAVHTGKHDLTPRRCFVPPTTYDLWLLFFCGTVALAALLAIVLRAIRNREDEIARALCWRIASYLVSFVASNMTMADRRLGEILQTDEGDGMYIPDHLHGFMTVLIYIWQSKLCLTKTEPLALPRSFTLASEQCNLEVCDWTDSTQTDLFASIRSDTMA